MNRRMLLVGALGAAAAFGCTESRAILTDPVSPNAYDYQMLSTGTNLPRGTAVFVFHRNAADATPDSVNVTLNGLDSLATGFYTAWAGDSLGTDGSWRRLTGLLTAVRQDTGFDAIGNAVPAAPISFDFGQQSAITNGGPRTTFTWKFTRASSGLAASDSIQTFMITIEGTNSATTPSASRRPLWARRGEGSAVPASGKAFRTTALKFGNWAPLALNEYLFSATPARGRTYIQANVMETDDSTLARAPMGYYYALFAVKAPPVGQLTGGDTLFMGELTSPWPRRNLSLYNSDSLVTDPLVVLNVPPSILSASGRMSADTIPKLSANAAAGTPYKGYTELRLNLESKNGFRGQMGAGRILAGAIPFFITVGQ